MKKKIKGKIKLSFELELPKELIFLKVKLSKVSQEIQEHLPKTISIFSKILIFIIPIAIITNLLFKIEVIPVFVLSFFPFVYGAFLPDFDSFMKFSKRKDSPKYQKILFFLFAPIYCFYLLFGKINEVYSKKEKEFHSKTYLLYYFLFLLFIGFLIFSPKSIYKQILFASLGSLGYLIHLLIDKNFFSKKIKKPLLKIYL